MEPQLDMSNVVRCYYEVGGVSYEFSSQFTQAQELANYLSQELGYTVEVKAIDNDWILLTTKTLPNGSMHTFWSQIREVCQRLGVSADTPRSIELFDEVDKIPEW